jgi:transcriptional regulator GlxA family with amidase domain
VSAASITDGSMALSDLLGDEAAVRKISGAAPEMSDGVDAIDSALRPYLAVADPSLQLLQRIFADMQTLPADARVADVARRAHVAPRTLQKLFRRYVGVGPKWALTRLRIHRALERLSTSPPAWTELALELGYYDHAHFIRDFRLVVGRSPSQFVAEATAAGR